jgi:ribosomal protein S18 acetylase RimI-like enzyme
MNVSIALADLKNPDQAAALVEIIDSYACEPGGQDAPLSAYARAHLVSGLTAHPGAMVVLASAESQYVGAAVCLRSFSTFAGKASINIHDFAVLPSFRGRGIGQAILAEVERQAREQACCKVTLEVRDPNEGAKRLYRSAGFGPWDVPTLFVTKSL